MPTCPQCHDELSIEGFDPTRKELRCSGCGELAIVVRGRPRAPIPVPKGLWIRRDGATLLIRRRGNWLGLALIGLGVGLIAVAALLAAAPGIFYVMGAIAIGRGSFDLWRGDWLRVAGGKLQVRGGLAVDVADLVQIYVVRISVGELEVRALDHGGAPWPLLRTGSLWVALAIEHVVEEHIGLLDVPMSG